MFAGITSTEDAKRAYRPLRDVVTVPRLTLGANTSAVLATDPKLLLFTLSKYKFAAKMLEGLRIIELGCMDATGTLLLHSMVSEVVALDFYHPHVEDCLSIQSQGYLPRARFLHRDILDHQPDLVGQFGGCVSFDVLEHLDPSHTELFFSRASSLLSKHGTFICGIPSLQSQAYASEINRQAHINCMEFEQLIQHARAVFANVYPFGLNDEVVHTGFHPMCQYNIVVCNGII